MTPPPAPAVISLENPGLRSLLRKNVHICKRCGKKYLFRLLRFPHSQG